MRRESSDIRRDAPHYPRRNEEHEETECDRFKGENGQLQPLHSADRSQPDHESQQDHADDVIQHRSTEDDLGGQCIQGI